MSDAIFEQFATGMATLNTAIQDAFGRDGNRLFLLKRATKSKLYESVAELTSGWQVEYGTTREELFLFYSTTDDMGDIFAQTSHIGYGVPDADDQIFVYEIQPDQKERTTPDVFSDSWKAFAIRVPQERYEVV